MKQRTRGYGFLLVAGLGLILAAQVLVYLMTIDLTIGVAPLFGRQHETPASSRLDLRAAILRSEMSSKIEGQDRYSYFDLSRKWQDLLANAGVRYDLVTDEDLASGIGVSYDVLVLPAAVCLSAVQKDVILGSLEAGMGVVAGGAVGARNEKCEWLGLDFTAELSGLREPEAVPTGLESHVLFRGGRFYAGFTPTGYNLLLPPQEIVVGTATTSDAYWSDRRARPFDGGDVQASAMATHGERGKGRFVWFGFRESLPEMTVADHRALDGYLQAAVLWSARQPLAALEDWPQRNRAAVVLANEVQENGVSVRAAVSLLADNRAPATFFVTPASAAANAEALLDASDLIDVAVTDSDMQPMIGRFPAVQAERLRKLKEGVERSLGGRRVRGFLPPQELADASTVEALKATGFDYYYDGLADHHLTPLTVRNAAVDWLATARQQPTRLSRAGKDDFEALATFPGSADRIDDFVTYLLEDFELAMDVGGAHTLLFHNDLIGAPANLPILERVIQRLRRNRVWMTTGRDLAHWHSTRSLVSVESRYVSANRIRLAVTNRGTDKLDAAVVNLQLPYMPDSVRVIPGVLRSGLPETTLADDRSVLSLEFPSIRAQSSYIFLIAMDEER